MESQSSPSKVESFEAMGLAPYLLQAIAQMKITTPTAIQCEATPIALGGQDLIGVAQTGSGKTLAYALAVMTELEKNPQSRALVMSSTRETAEQVFRVFQALVVDTKISMTLAVTGVPTGISEKELKKNPRLIVATPGRISDHLKNNKLLLQKLSILVIDEADRMLELGFGEQLKFIQSTLRGERQTMMFAASFGKSSEPIAKLFMRPDPVILRTEGVGQAVATLQQKVYFLSHAQKNNRLIDELKRMHDGGIIVFADSQESCVALGRLLAHHGHKSDFVHGDMNPGHRNRVLREFREEQIRILVTTDLLARGLDVAHVKHIVNFDLPYKGEDFLHRIGRTARAGREGSAITFITPSDGRTYRKIKNYLDGAMEETIMQNFKFDERTDLKK